MDKETVQIILASGSAMLKEFAVAAKTTAEHVYAVLVRQQFVEGISMLVGLAVWSVAVFLITHKYIRPWYNKASKDPYSDAGFAAAVFFLATAFGFLLISGFVSVAVGKLLNPEFYAMKFILDSVRGN